MKRIILTVVAVGIILIIYPAYTVMTLKSMQMKDVPAAPVRPFPGAVEHLAEAIRIPTVSFADSLPVDSSAFKEFDLFLRRRYPRVHQELSLRLFNRFSRLYRWKGRDTTLRPVILAAHLDVVPVPDDERDSWTQPPFSGKVDAQFIHGRGAIDDKLALIGILEAVEHLLRQQFRPRRDIWLAFGHDEEIGGRLGARVMARWLKQKGIRAEWVLDEGYAVLQKMVPGIDGDVAVIGTAEKGYATIRLDVSLSGGHSSLPAAETAIDRLAGAVYRLKHNPFPMRFADPVKQFIRFVAPEMSLPGKFIFANNALLEPVLLRIYGARPSGNAMVRTTTAPTLFQSGSKDNIIPAYAQAVINFRLLPGDTKVSVLRHIRETVHDELITIRVMEYFNPSPVSPVDNPAFRHLQRTVHAVFPDAVVTPNLVVGGTDGRYYYAVSEAVYRFVPFYINPESIHIFHGINERVPIKVVNKAVTFYTELIKNQY